MFLSISMGGNDSSDSLVEAVGAGNFNKIAFETMVKSCLEKTLAYSIFTIGRNGGYMDIESNNVLPKISNIVPVIDPQKVYFDYEQKVVFGKYFPKGTAEDKHVPLYVGNFTRLGTDTTWTKIGERSTKLPTFTSMETAMTNFVQANVWSCISPRLKDIAATVDVYVGEDETLAEDLTSSYSPTVTLQSRTDDILVTMDMPMKIVDGTKEHTYTQFNGGAQIGLKRIYEVVNWFIGNADAANTADGTYVLIGDECNKYESASDQSKYLLNGRTNIYVLPSQTESHYVIKFVDFQPKQTKYRDPFEYQFAMDGLKIQSASNADDRDPSTCPLS